MSTAGIGALAHIGKSVSIKGELSGSEDVYINGKLEGKIELSGGSLTIGPDAEIRADISARNVYVGGKLDGNIQAVDRTEMRKTSVVKGDVQTQRIAIEDGACFNGKLEISKESQTQPSASLSAAAATGTIGAGSGKPQNK